MRSILALDLATRKLRLCQRVSSCISESMGESKPKA
jgi:hypothetical protein